MKSLQRNSRKSADKPSEPLSRKLRGRRKPGMKDRIFFTEQLSLLLETGTPLHVALQALGSQIDNPAMREIIDGLHEHVTDGKPFSYALAQYPQMFPITYVNLVAAAEEGGFMDKVLLELMNMDEKRDELKRTVTGAVLSRLPGRLLHIRGDLRAGGRVPEIRRHVQHHCRPPAGNHHRSDERQSHPDRVLAADHRGPDRVDHRAGLVAAHAGRMCGSGRSETAGHRPEGYLSSRST